MVRLLIAGLGDAIPLPIDEIESIKIAVSEAINNSIRFAYDKKQKNNFIDIKFEIEKRKLIIYVIDKGKGFDLKNHLLKRKGDKELTKFGLLLINSLMDTVKIRTGKTGTTVKMIKKIKQ